MITTHKINGLYTIACPCCNTELVRYSEQGADACNDPLSDAGDGQALSLTEEQQEGVTFDCGLWVGTCACCEECYCIPYLALLQATGNEAVQCIRFNDPATTPRDNVIAMQGDQEWILETFNSKLGVIHLHSFGCWPASETPLCPWDQAAESLVNIFSPCKTLLINSNSKINS